MAKPFYISTETRQQVLRLLAMEGDEQAVSIDFSAWAEDNAEITTATWSVESGNAAIEGEALASNVASARITTADSGRSLIKISATDGTRTKTVFMEVLAKDPNARFANTDYGFVRI